MKNRRKSTKICTLLLMLAFGTLCSAQNKAPLSEENIKSENQKVTTANGPNRITRNIIQDRKGNIWLASWQGIFRHDGKSFTNITGNVSSARFFSVLEDRKGNFWFGSIGSGVYYYDGKTFKNFTTKDGLAGNSITCIYEDKAGNIWFATGEGASYYDGKSFRNLKMTAAPSHGDADSIHVSVYQHTIPENNGMHNDVNAIIEDKKGKFWFGTRGYARVYDGKTFTILTNNHGKPFTNVRTIIKDKKGSIWLGGNDGLWRYDGRTFTNFTKNFVGYIYEDRKGNIWASSEESIRGTWALSRYDGKSLSDKQPIVTLVKSKSPMVFGILEAFDGSIWYGSFDGVHRYDGKTITGFNDEEGQK